MPCGKKRKKKKEGLAYDQSPADSEGYGGGPHGGGPG